MNRYNRKFSSLVLSATMLAAGCKPMQPFYFGEDGDLSHYLDVATQTEFADVEEPSLDEVNNALAPLTVNSFDNYQMWDLTLQEVVNYTLCNSQVLRNLGGLATAAGLGGGGINQASDVLTRRGAIQNTPTVYDPALVETGNGVQTGSPFDGTGVEAALSEFDARLDASVFWEKNRRPQNRPDSGFGADLFPPIFAQDLATSTIGITKQTASGGIFGFRNNTNYEGNNVSTGGLTPFRALASDWQTNFEATFSQPLLQGRGVQFNRIAAPHTFDQYAAGIPPQMNGVAIARIRTDLTLADFEIGVRDLLHDVETDYWDLYFRYRDLQARTIGRDSALATWRTTASLLRSGLPGGDRAREAQARSQYHQFEAQVKQAFTDLLRAERRLRYRMGLSSSDGRLIRPADSPAIAKVAFDWSTIHFEALARREEIRRQKWEVKKRELELIAARNFLLPRVDAVGRYRWLGLGDDLIRPSRGASAFNEPGSTAFGVLTSGEFQEWQLGLQASIPIGYRRELAGVRHQELHLAKERALLQDLELESIHQLAESISDVELNYALTQQYFNRRAAAEDEVRAVESRFEAGNITVDLVLDAQRRRAEAETEYYRSLVDYNRAIMRVHYRKGSLLDYDGVYLAEGPWPGKAYFDALRQARKRDAATYIDYGFTRPNVFSRGPVQQGCPDGCDSGLPLDASGITPAPDQAIPIEGAPVDESLPMPDAESLRGTPTGETSSRAHRPYPMTQSVGSRGNSDHFRFTADEYQAHYPPSSIAPAAAIGHGGQR
jgi:outer membrane protein TolC